MCAISDILPIPSEQLLHNGKLVNNIILSCICDGIMVGDNRQSSVKLLDERKRIDE